MISRMIDEHFVDLEGPRGPFVEKLTFHAKSKDVFLYWHDPEYGGEIQVAKIEKGKAFEESSHPGHVFRIYDSEEKTNMEVVTVDGKYGEHTHIEL